MRQLIRQHGYIFLRACIALAVTPLIYASVESWLGSAAWAAAASAVWLSMTLGTVVLMVGTNALKARPMGERKLLRLIRVIYAIKASALLILVVISIVYRLPWLGALAGSWLGLLVFIAWAAGRNR